MYVADPGAVPEEGLPGAGVVGVDAEVDVADADGLHVAAECAEEQAGQPLAAEL